MPYHLHPADGGFYVLGEDGTRHSKKPLTQEMAKRQLTALNIAHARKADHRIPPPMIRMPVGEFRREHKRLVKTLKEGDRVKRMAEANRQMAELKERLG
jgi:hypothetical protein